MKYLFVLLAVISFEISFPQSITLRDTTNQYDYIIITIPEFVQACQTFKQHKESYNGFNVLIVDTGQIYNEFNSVSLPQNNIREFISYAGTYWENPKLKYVLLVGNISSIPGFYISSPIPGYNQYHQSDFYYSISKFEPDTLTTEFNVGRLPVFSIDELTNYFNKVVWYELNTQLYNWMNTNLFLCEYEEMFDFLERYQWIAQDLPDNFNKKFYEDSDTSQYYGNLDSLMNFVNNQGTSILWFSGRTYDSSFMAMPSFLIIEDLTYLNNFEKYFISIFYTQSAILDSNTNIAREILFLQNSGSIGSVVINGNTFWPTIAYIQKEWARRFYSPENYSVAEAIDTFVIPTSYYLRRVINFWGDPSLKLKYDPIVKVDEIVQEFPDDFILYNNYPSPFNSSTKIKYQIPFQSNVSLKVYDVLGNEVAALVNEVKPAGKYEVGFTENNLASGIYFYTLQAGNYRQTKKMLLLK